MTDIDFHPLVSEAVQERYARAQFEYKRARAELLDAWVEMVRGQYAREQGPPDAEEDCHDLG